MGPPEGRRPVAGAGPLIALARAGRLELLAQLFGGVVAPPEVWEEIAGGGASAASAAHEGWLEAAKPGDAERIGRAYPWLDAGEAAAIALAVERGTLLLIDEVYAFTTAREMGVPAATTVDVIVAAKEAGLLDSVRPALEELRAAGVYLDAAFVDDLEDFSEGRTLPPYHLPRRSVPPASLPGR